MAWVSQGPITDRTVEHLVTSDKGILLYRNVLRENAERVQRGEDPLGIVRDPDKNFPMIQIRRGSTYAGFREGIPENQWGGISSEAAGIRN